MLIKSVIRDPSQALPAVSNGRGLELKVATIYADDASHIEVVAIENPWLSAETSTASGFLVEPVEGADGAIKSQVKVVCKK